MLSKRAAKFLELALDESTRSTYTRVKIGAVVVRGSKVLSKGANLSTSHPTQCYWNRATKRVAPMHNLHAEMHALVRAKRSGVSLKGATIYVARLNKNNHLSQCRPCVACMAAIADAGILAVVHTTDKELDHGSTSQKQAVVTVTEVLPSGVFDTEVRRYLHHRDRS